MTALYRVAPNFCAVLNCRGVSAVYFLKNLMKLVGSLKPREKAI